MKLDEIQKDFLLETFFKDESFAGWKSIGESLLDTGKCTIAGESCPWMGGIGNFITIAPASGDCVGCCVLSLDLESFVSKDHAFFQESYDAYLNNLNNKCAEINAQLESLRQF